MIEEIQKLRHLLDLANDALEVCHQEGYTTSVAFVHFKISEALQPVNRTSGPQPERESASGEVRG